jgi:GT2 family glycosyltransferase
VQGAAALVQKTPLVCCVVINWNGWQDTTACVQALLGQNYPGLEIVVVDNASTDDSVQRIRAAFPEIEMVQAGENRGFAAGSNLGIMRAMARGAEFVWLLNNDTIAPPDTLGKLVAAAEADARAGIVGTVLHYPESSTAIQAWGGGSMRPWMGYVTHYYSPAKLEGNSFATFASVLLRREMLEQTGLLDDGYFMYFEDADLCFRAKAAGWKLAVAGGTSVLHKEGGSGAKSLRLDRMVTASGLRFLDRHGRPRGLAKFLYVTTRLGKRMIAGKPKSMRAVMRGVRDWRRNDPLGFLEEQ